MIGKWTFLAIAAVCAVTVGLAVVVLLAKQHTKTKIVVKTKTVVKAPPFNGTPIGMATYLKTVGRQVGCPPALSRAVCFQFEQRKWFVFLAVPPSAVAS